MICFHHNDADGKCSAAILYNKYLGCHFYEMDYNKQLPFRLIKSYESVFIVDFSINADDMKKLLKITPHVTWIDHHKTILDHPFNNDSIKGIRRVGKSGCELTWEYLYSNKPTPLSVKLIGDYDTWKLSIPESKPFVFGLRIQEIDPKSNLWKILFSKDSVSNRIINRIIDDGKVILKFVIKIGDDYCKEKGFETIFDGYNCIAQGLYDFGSTLFGDKINKYDICISYEYLGDVWRIGLLSAKVDVSKIAKKYGKKYGTSGGGHKGASSFFAPELPFKKVK